MLKLKVSYVPMDKEELDELVRILLPYIRDYKIAKGSSGGYNRAYIELKPLRNKRKFKGPKNCDVAINEN